MSVLNKDSKRTHSYDIKITLEQNILNSIIYSDPYVKTVFFIKLIDLLDLPVIYLDFDLLYSGYVTAKIVPKHDKLGLFQPTRDRWNDLFRKIITDISRQRTILILDSLNGFFSMFNDKKDVGMFINSSIMLISAIAKMTSSTVVVASMAKKEEQGWVLSTIGRQIIDAKNMSKIQLEQENSKIKMNVVSSEDASFVIPIDFELR
ncbi:MAG: hypothetical protein FJ356_00225 [Thaumarchaeota archaeon]|nr:hypothetical protein [Nitrososphaerota archaeon]